MTGPLDGVLVADFSRVLAGPLATATLADLGAEVIKVERPGTGDDTRHWGPPWTATSSSYFGCANRSKKSIALDLSDPDDQQVARDLAARCDVLVENFRTGGLAKHGLGYEDVSATNPGVVYASITGFGSQEGAALAGYDFLVQAVGGLMSITGPPDEPSKVGVALVDVLTAKDAVAGILAALHARHRDGLGQWVEVNLLSSLLGSLANQASGYLATGEPPRSMGNQHPSIAPYETLTAKDGQLALACGNDGQFQRLCQVIGRPALAQDARFVSNSERVRHRAALVRELETALAGEDVATWVERLSGVGVPAGKVGSIADGFALAESLGLEPTVLVGEQDPPQVRSPLRLSRTPVDTYGRPPALGEHTEQVRQWLAKESIR